MKRILLSGLAALLAACASTPSPEAEPQRQSAGGMRADMAQPFMIDIDGTRFHPGSGLRCPAEELGLPLRRAELSRPDGSDMICHYHQRDTRLSYFLTSVPQRLTEEAYVQGGYGGMRDALGGQGFVVDEAATQACRDRSGTPEAMAADLIAGVLGAQQRGDTDIQIVMGRETLVMTKGDAVSIMLFDEAAPGLFLKLRYTSANAAASAACDRLVPLFDAREADVRAVAGDGLAELLLESASDT